MNKKPICFIAMAFNRDDTDILYEKLILPVLIQNEITPVIINRRESNDDLNIQIIEQLERADFVIADLTYTRPSVYFEAGFAQRNVEVIYTVRSDHLNKGNSDELRVHFDLSMKNIIDWEDVNDKYFSSRLEKRIKATFLNEWLRKRNINNLIENDRKEFASQSAIESLKSLRAISIKEIEKKGYLNWRIEHPIIPSQTTFSVSDIKEGRYNYISTKKTIGKKVFLLSINAYSSATKTKLDEINNIYKASSIRYWINQKELTKDNRLIVNLFFISIRNIPLSRIQDLYPEFKMVTNQLFSDSTQFKIYDKNRKSNYLKLDYYLHFISSIKSTPEYLINLNQNINSKAIEI